MKLVSFQNFREVFPVFFTKLVGYCTQCGERRVKGKGEVHPRTGHEGPEGRWSMPHPGHF